MAQNSDIQHPENEALLVIRKWQVAVCDGRTCAAALLSFFGYWHGIRLQILRKPSRRNAITARQNGDINQHEGVIQFHTAENLVQGLMGLYKIDTIRRSITYLVERGFILKFRNPNPRYKFDKTAHFVFCVAAVRNALDEYLQSNDGDSRAKAQKLESRSLINRQPSPKNRLAIPEITSEITAEVTSENYSALAGSANKIAVNAWPRPDQIFRDLEYLHGVDPMFTELQLVEFRSWWSEKNRFTTGEWDAKFLQRCVNRWDSRRT